MELASTTALRRRPARGCYIMLEILIIIIIITTTTTASQSYE